MSLVLTGFENNRQVFVPVERLGTFSLVAAQTVSALRVVTTNSQGRAVYANPSDPAIAGQPLFLTLQSAVESAFVRVQPSGVVTDPGWAWVPGVPIWLAENGILTQTTPSAGAVVQVAQSIEPTRVLFSPQEAILL